VVATGGTDHGGLELDLEELFYERGGGGLMGQLCGDLQRQLLAQFVQ